MIITDNIYLTVTLDVSTSLHPAGVRARRALLDPRLSDDPAPPPSPAAVEGEATLTPALCEQRSYGY